MTGLLKTPSVFCLCKTESISLHSFANIQLGLEHGKKKEKKKSDVCMEGFTLKFSSEVWVCRLVHSFYSKKWGALAALLGTQSWFPASSWCLQPSIIPLSGDLLPSSGFCEYYTHVHKPTYPLSSSVSLSVSLFVSLIHTLSHTHTHTTIE